MPKYHKHTRAFARADRMHKTLDRLLDGSRTALPHDATKQKILNSAGLPSVDVLTKQLQANQSAFIALAERVAIFGASQAELQQLEELRESIAVLERDIKEYVHA